jgi:hypothetical protein
MCQYSGWLRQKWRGLDTIQGNILHLFIKVYTVSGARGRIVVKALCYKPEGRGFETRGGEFVNLPNLSGRIRPWG